MIRYPAASKSPTPKFKHDCPDCYFLESFDDLDFYTCRRLTECPSSFIVRYGDEDSHYYSYPISFVWKTIREHLEGKTPIDQHTFGRDQKKKTNKEVIFEEIAACKKKRESLENNEIVPSKEMVNYYASYASYASGETIQKLPEETTLNVPKFWLVWSPEGGNARVKHATKSAAHAEASRLSYKEPDKNFYVMQTDALYYVQKIQRMKSFGKE